MGYSDNLTRGIDSEDKDRPRSRKENEDDRRFAYRCMMQAHRMMKPPQEKRGMRR